MMYRLFWLVVFSLPVMAEPFLPYTPGEVEDIKRIVFCAGVSLFFRVVVVAHRRGAKGLGALLLDALLTGIVAGGALGILAVGGIKISFTIEYLAALAVASRGPRSIALIENWFERSRKGGKDADA